MKYIITMKKAVIALLCVICVQLPCVHIPVAGQRGCMYPPAEGAENIVVLRVQYAATTPNEEYIVIFNKGDTSVDLSGWVVFNSYYETYRHLPSAERTNASAWNHIYKIPYGAVLNPKYWVRICSGRGEDNELYLYRNLNEQWLDDEGDTVYLMDNYCNVISEYSWP